MDAFWTTILGKALTECGLFNVFTLFCLGMVCIQNVKIRAQSEVERQAVEKSREAERSKWLELVNDSNEINRDLSVTVESLKATLAMFGHRK